MRKFDAKLKLIASSLSKADVDTIPKNVKNYISNLITFPLKDDLTLMEQNRLTIDPTSGRLE